MGREPRRISSYLPSKALVIARKKSSNAASSSPSSELTTPRSRKTPARLILPIASVGRVADRVIEIVQYLYFFTPEIRSLEHPPAAKIEISPPTQTYQNAQLKIMTSQFLIVLCRGGRLHSFLTTSQFSSGVSGTPTKSIHVRQPSLYSPQFEKPTG